MTINSQGIHMEAFHENIPNFILCIPFSQQPVPKTLEFATYIVRMQWLISVVRSLNDTTQLSQRLVRFYEMSPFINGAIVSFQITKHRTVLYAPLNRIIDARVIKKNISMSTLKNVTWGLRHHSLPIIDVLSSNDL